MQTETHNRRTGWILAGLAAAALAVAQGWLDPSRIAWETHVLQGIGVEALHGTTEGRQAVVGSVGYGLLPALLTLTLQRLGVGGAHPWAAVLAGAVGMGAFFAFGWRMLRRALPCVWALPLAVALLLHPAWRVLALDAPAALALGAAAACLTLWADWAAAPRLRHLLPAAGALAAAVLMPADLLGWLLSLGVVWILLMLLHPATRKRSPATLLLALLPALYALAVWMLLNWLVMGEPLRFLRGLMHHAPTLWPLTPPSALAVRALTPSALAAMLICLGALPVAGWRRDPSLLMLALGGLAAQFWAAFILPGSALDWTVTAVDAMGWLAALLALARLVAMGRGRFPDAMRLVGIAPLIALMLTFLLAPEPPPAAAPAWRQIDAASRWTREQSPYARVFACGTDALALVWDQPPSPAATRPVLDLYLPELRRAYYGQPLYLLIPAPAGRGRLDPFVARYPHAYRAGMERLLFVKDWDTWRLYQVVTAPDRLPGQGGDGSL